MLHRIKLFMEKHRMAAEGEHIIVAVSGGADSVSLLMILKELSADMNFSLEAVHVEHGIRGRESIGDAEFTKALCRQLDIVCTVKSVDVPMYACKEGIGHEEAARILRYGFFAEIARERAAWKYKKVKVALAHHMEDNAETILFQLIRGSGIKGLCGMAPMRTDEEQTVYIRPLLCVRRAEIETYLEEKHQKFRTDATNLQLLYSRNRLRHMILPGLCQINPQAVVHLNQSACQLSQVWEYMQSQSEIAMEELVVREEPLTIHAEKFARIQPALKSMVGYELIARAAGKRKDICAKHVEELIWLADAGSGRQVNLPHGVLAKKEYSYLILESLGSVQKKNLGLREEDEICGISREDLDSMQLGEMWKVKLDEKGTALVLSKQLFDGNMDKIPKKKCTKWLDYDMIKNSFQVRKRRAGDFFVNDAKGHRKKIKQYFIDRKIPASERNQIWLVADGSEILWIVGDRMNEAYKVSKATKTILQLDYIEGR